jgi:predicted nucleic acid-binding protein
MGKRLELWNGAGGDREKKVLREFEQVLPELPMTTEAWARATDLARRARQRGLSVPAMDIAIAACAQESDATLESADSDFAALRRLTSQ